MGASGERVKEAGLVRARYALSWSKRALVLYLLPRDFSDADVPEGHVICSVPRVPWEPICPTPPLQCWLRSVCPALGQGRIIVQNKAFYVPPSRIQQFAEGLAQTTWRNVSARGPLSPAFCTCARGAAPNAEPEAEAVSAEVKQPRDMWKGR